MGNYSLKDCGLKSGFAPVGIASYGDIIYIASYNDSTKECELGTYPSPKYSLNGLGNQSYAEDLELENNYKPLWNLYDGTNRKDFTTNKLNFDLEHPVDIEIQPSYDGSVNLILNDDKNEPKLINSGFSIYENRKVRLVKRDQKEATNLYLESKFDNQTRLKKVTEKIPRFELIDVLSTGQLKGGNYTFYLKMADGDYNKSDIVAESAQVSIFNGTPTSINSVHGTLLNETTDKSVQFRINNIDTSFSNFYILYSREFSDLNGVRQYEVFELTNAFEINENDLLDDNGEKSYIIQIDGSEQVNQISETELNIEYVPIDSVKTQAQLQNMLFLANIHSENSEYKRLQELAYTVKVTLLQNKTGIGWVTANYKYIYSQEYYDPKNIYNYLGYWPEEYYRFGIVFIKEDDTLTPAFNLIGKELSSIGDDNSGCNVNWEDYANNNYIVAQAPYWNRNGVFKNPFQQNNKVQNYDDKTIYPWYYRFDTSFDLKELESLGIKGYFIVRQKRVPTILCQGMSISIDKTSHTPMLYDPDFNPTQSDKSRRICNGEIFFNTDAGTSCKYKKATQNDKYFTESFLSNHLDDYLWDDPFDNKGKKANYHMYLVSDGRSILDCEKGDKKYTALGDHIIRTNEDHKQCSALLSLDPCVIPELQTQLNGEKRLLIPQDQLQFHAVLTTETLSEETVWDVTKVNNNIYSLQQWFNSVYDYLYKFLYKKVISNENPFENSINGLITTIIYWTQWNEEAYITDTSNKKICLPELNNSRWATICSTIQDWITAQGNTEQVETLNDDVQVLADDGIVVVDDADSDSGTETETVLPRYMVSEHFGKIYLDQTSFEVNPSLFDDTIGYTNDPVNVYDSNDNFYSSATLQYKHTKDHGTLVNYVMTVDGYGRWWGSTTDYKPTLTMTYVGTTKFYPGVGMEPKEQTGVPVYVDSQIFGKIEINTNDSLLSDCDCSKTEDAKRDVWYYETANICDINGNALFPVTIVWKIVSGNTEFLEIVIHFDRGTDILEIYYGDGYIYDNIASLYCRLNRITGGSSEAGSDSGSGDSGSDSGTDPFDLTQYTTLVKLFSEDSGKAYNSLRKEVIQQLNNIDTQKAIASGSGYIHGNSKFAGTPAYFTRAFTYDSLATSQKSVSDVNNKVIFINSNNASKSIPHPEDQEKNLVYVTVAGDPADVSKVAIFGEGDEYRNKGYGAQFKWALRGIYCPILGVDDIGSDNYPFLTDNTIYNIYTNNYNPRNETNVIQWFTARSIDQSPYYAVSDRYTIDKTAIDIYRGDCFTNTVTFRINRNFVDPEVPITNEVLSYSSWAENSLNGLNSTTKEDWAKINRADVNAVSLGMWVTFKCMSNYNLGIRSEDRQHTDEMSLMGNPRSFFPLAGISAECGQKIEESWLLNGGYNATVSRKTHLLNKKLPYQKTDYSNRIMFSNIAVKDSFSNGYRVFQGASYRDIDNQYGEITKLVPWGNNLFCVFEHGCAIIPVNEKALMQTTTEQTIHIYGYGVIPEQLSVISQDFGSIWADSIIRTPLGIYGVDTSAKKIWRYTDSKGFETISDMIIQRFLNDNLLITESDKSTNVLTRNVKTHYNAYKGDVMFTFIKDSFTWNLCYNERQGMWITKYSWIPVYSENINNQFYSFGLEQAKEGDSKLYLHGRSGIFDEINYMDDNYNNQIKPTKWYDKQEPFEFEFIVREDVGLHKIFDNLILVSNNVQPEEIQFTLIGDSYLFNKARLYHDAQEGQLNIYKNQNDGFNKELLRGTIANPYTPLETKYLKNTKIQYDPILDQYELVMNQETKNMETFGRRLGNIHYKEDAWYVVFDPIVFDENINSQSVEQTSPKWKTVPLRDKWLKIRIKYKGDQLAIITALNTIYRLTSS